MTTLIMRQTGKNRWRIETESGTILLDDIILGHITEAEEFVKAYVSTWGWLYRLEEL